MIAEGLGKVKPIAVEVRMTSGVLSLLYGHAIKQANRNYTPQYSGWKGGLVRPVLIPNAGMLQKHELPVFAGILGEWGVCEYINRHFPRPVAKMDLEERRYGDGGIDLDPFGTSIQVKTRLKDNNPSLIRVKDDSGRTLDAWIKPEIYCFCSYDVACGGWVNFLGWQKTSLLQLLPMVNSRIGRWMNIEVEDKRLNPPIALIDRLKSRELLHGNH
jgi:hypothetical protein